MEKDLLQAVISYGPYRLAHKLSRFNVEKSYKYTTLLSLTEYITELEFADIFMEMLLHNMQDLKEQDAFKDFLKNEKSLCYLYLKLDLIGQLLLEHQNY